MSEKIHCTSGLRQSPGVERSKYTIGSRVCKNGYNMRSIAYAFLGCLLSFFHCPPPLFATVSVCVEPEDEIRARAAYVAAGATVVLLGGGVAYLLCHPGGKSHCHSSSNSRHHSSHDHYSYSKSRGSSENFDYSSSSFYDTHGSSYSDFYSSSFPSEVLRSKSLPSRQKSTRTGGHESHSPKPMVSGSFLPYPVANGQGSVTLFVQLPDGATRVLGNVPISANGSPVLCYGPFDQLGNYTFGLSVDLGTILPAQAKIGSLKIDVGGSMADSCDFFLPAHCPVNYEPAPYVFHQG